MQMLRAATGLAVALALPTAAAFDGFGEWRGQAQYMVEKHGEQAPALHEVIPMVIRIDPDGKIVGTSTNNSCRLLGLARPMAGNVMTLSATLDACKHKPLNRKYSGTLALYPKAGRLQLSLQKMETSRPVTMYKVKSSMRR